MAVEKSDWSKIETGDLMTLLALFDRAVEQEDGSVTMHLNDVHWSRCVGVRYEIAHEIIERGEEPSS